MRGEGDPMANEQIAFDFMEIKKRDRFTLKKRLASKDDAREAACIVKSKTVQSSTKKPFEASKARLRSKCGHHTKASWFSQAGVREESSNKEFGEVPEVVHHKRQMKAVRSQGNESTGNQSQPISLDTPQSRVSVLDQLRKKTGCIQHAEELSDKTTFSTGIISLDRWIPAKGLKFDSITEWVSERRGSGAMTLAFLAAASCLRSEAVGCGPLVVVSPDDSFYPPSATAFGIPASRILWVRASGRKDQVWAVDQALRCKSISGVLALLPNRLDDRDARRFQLASEQGRTPGFFVRSNAVRGQPCFAEVRFHVSSFCQHAAAELEGSFPRMNSSRRFHITLERCRGGQVGRNASFEMHDCGEVQEIGFERKGSFSHDKTLVHLVSKLANPEIARRRAAVVDRVG